MRVLSYWAVPSFDWFCQHSANARDILLSPDVRKVDNYSADNLRVLNFDWTTSKFYPMDKVISTLRTTWPWILEHIRLAQHLNFSFDLSGEQDSASS